MKSIKSLMNSKNLYLSGAILSILSVFLFFAPTISWKGTASGTQSLSMFSYCFGISPATRYTGYTALFVFMCLAIIISGFIVYFGLIAKNESPLTVLSIILSILCLIILIISFLTLSIISVSQGHPTKGNYLGAGPILVGVINTLIIIINIGGIIFGLKTGK